MTEFYRAPQGPFSAAVLKDAGQHFAKESPNEACGLVCDGRYVPCANIASEPLRRFEVDPVAVAKAHSKGSLQGVLHSHPGGPWHPSASDMQGQQDSGVPWAIMVPGEVGAELACVLGGERPKMFDSNGDHIQRPFLHGVSDCYSLIRDWYGEILDVVLPDVPREWLWWKNPDLKASLYLEYLEQAGGRVVSTDPTEYAKILQPGDVFLRKVDSKIPNHGGVYIGHNLALEQMPRSLSQRRPIGPALHVISHIVRLV